MKVLVLGSRSGAGLASQRTQGSVALSADGERWLLLNASPDLGEQIRANPALQPRGQGDTPIHAVVLMDAHVEHVAGLQSLRDGPPIDIYATPCVFDDLSNGLPLPQTLQHYCGVRWHMVAVAGETRVAGFRVAGFESLCFTAIATHGPAPAYATHRTEATVGANIALYVEDSVSGQSLFYSPGPASVGDEVLDWMREADCLLLDAALEARADADMASLADEAEGRAGTMSPTMIDLLNRLPCRKVLAHLRPGSLPTEADAPDARDELSRHGFEIAHDGMEIVL